MHKKKEKADIGLTQIMADLMEAGYHISSPLSEHLRYDAIIEKERYLAILKCKCVTAKKEKV